MESTPSEEADGDKAPSEANDNTPVSSCFDDVDTGPVPVMPARFPVRRDVRDFELLTPEELTPEEIFEVRKLTTALYHAQQLLNTKQRLEQPEPYAERFYVWFMLFRQLVPLAILLATGGLILAVNSQTIIGDPAGSWLVGTLFVVALGCVWWGLRVYYEWRHTVVYSDVAVTGVRRPRNRWLLINDKRPTMKTSSIQAKKVSRGHLTSFFNLNCWRISLDSPSDEDKIFKGLKFVKNGEELMATIEAVQDYLAQQ